MNEYVDMQQIRSLQNPGQGGVFSGGSYSITCAMSSHHNSDNFVIAPGVRNGAQHTHDYAGNEGTNFASVDQTLEESSTTCTNGDRHPFFWPVLRDLRGQGPDVGADGGSLDGNIGSFVEPSSVDYTFHGHGTRRAEAMPLNITLVTGSAKAGTKNGEGSNAKFTCSGAGGRMTDLYAMCPQGSALQRVFDFPSCWNGQDLDSEDHHSHIVYPDEDGECAQDFIPVPALRVTVNYDDVPPGRQFAIDSFPEQQHNPITDHALLEYLSSERRAQEGVECINAARRCTQGAEQDAAATGSSDAADQVPPSRNFAHALATHATAHSSHPSAASGHGGSHARPGAGHHTVPGADGPASRALPATLPPPDAGTGPLRAWGAGSTLGPLPGLAPLPPLAAPLGPADRST
ncbi:DUF1996 domain-containing protein [Actinomycetospora sp. NBRC 106375]|uniref:DUF1996 domain-containing protein n=1 Tax=Actinomycetospora sp. NBRC 106375 TaxID=3032207 RepID=UPI002554E57F|nr:DUF1996 domain-containing protein [Actinomycetospora sp. NBRC 106375]